MTPHSPTTAARLIPLLLWLVASITHAAETYDHSGIPYYEFYSEKEFKTKPRGLQIAVSPDNSVYFSHEHMLHSFNGSNWDDIYHPPQGGGKITAIAWIDGSAYIGCNNSIGTLIVDEHQQAAYVTFDSPQSNEFFGQNFNVIQRCGDKIVFGAERGVAILDPQTEAIEFHDLEMWLRRVFVFQDTIYAVSDSNGVLRYENGSFILDPKFSEFTGAQAITDTSQSPEGDLVLGTYAKGLYRFDGQRFQPLHTDFFSAKMRAITHIQFNDTGDIIACVAGEGIFVIDQNGRQKYALTESLDYRFGNPRKTVVDKNGVVWALFHSYVAKFIPNNPLTAVDERLRPPLHFPDALVLEGKLLLRNRGEISEAIHNQEKRLVSFQNKFPDLPPTAVTVTASPQGLYLGLEKSVYEYGDSGLKPIIENVRYERLLALNGDSDLLLGVAPQKSDLYKREDGQFKLISTIESSGKFVHGLAQDAAGNIWLEMGHSAVGRLWIQDEKLHTKTYTADHGLPEDWISHWHHQDNAYFTSGLGVQEFDPKTDSFIQSTILDPIIPREKQTIYRAASDPQGNIFIASNDSITAFWLQPDGNFQDDSETLAGIGELYFDLVVPLPDRTLIFITPQQMFHLDPKLRNHRSYSARGISINRISNIEGDRNKYFHIGYNETPPSLAFEPDFRNIAFHLSDASSDAIRPPQYQFKLDGLTDEWSIWSISNEIYFTSLQSGDYNLKVRTRFVDGAASQSLQYAFTVQPKFTETWAAYVIYAILCGLVLVAAVLIYSRQLKARNASLGKMVAERTSEIETKNSELEKQAEVLEIRNIEMAATTEESRLKSEQLADALAQLQATQNQLLDTARKAGMAEVATNVLHNVGNVLNSINVGVVNLSQKMDTARAPNLSKIAALLQDNRDHLDVFLTNDQRGKSIPDYLSRLANVTEEEFEDFHKEMTELKENLDHVKRIVANQQSRARSSNMIQTLDLSELAENAVTLIFGKSTTSSLQITRDISPDLVIESDRHKILQMLTNFIKNARESIAEAQIESGKIHIHGRKNDPENSVLISITDNGLGIEPENISKLFHYGFTTKTDGHGFGLHSCSNAAKALGGDLRIESDGIGKGATITLTLPKTIPARGDKAALAETPSV